MTTLIACLTTGKGSWLQVMDLLNVQEWEKIVLFTNKFGEEKFKTEKEVEFAIIDENLPVKDLKDQMKKWIKRKVPGFEVALNIDSGSGKEHMALISAVIQSGLSMRYVTVENEQLVEITPYDN